MAKAQTTIGVWQPTAILMRKIKKACGLSTQQQVDIWARAEARRLGLKGEPLPHECPKCAGDLMIGTATGAQVCRSPACDYVSP